MIEIPANSSITARYYDYENFYNDEFYFFRVYNTSNTVSGSFEGLEWADIRLFWNDSDGSIHGCTAKDFTDTTTSSSITDTYSTISTSASSVGTICTKNGKKYYNQRINYGVYNNGSKLMNWEYQEHTK